MTCIVGVVHDGDVYMGGDSAGTDGHSLFVRSDPKVFRNGPFVMGFTSSFRMGQLLQYSFDPPERVPSKDLFTYMATDFIDGVRGCLKRGRFARKSDDVESAGTFLVGHAGRLFTIDDDYQVAELADDFDACGSGVRVALGSLYATKELPPVDRLQLALEAASRFTAGVCPPFHFEVLEGVRT